MNSKKILIVDDDETTLTLLESRLNAEGYEIFKARDGEEAVDKSKSILPDLIIMDIILPDIDGPDAIRMINEYPQTRSIKKIIFLSSILEKQNERGKSEVNVGGMTYSAFSKPIDFEILLPMIQRKLIE